MRALVADLKARTDRSGWAAATASRKRHVGRGKLLPRERMRALLDPGSPFLELSPARGLRHVRRRGAGGRASSPASAGSSGRECVIVVNDATVKGGTYYPDDGEEAPARAGDRRARTACPASTWSIPAAPTCRNQDEVFPDREHFGRIFYNQANMSAAGHPADRRGHGLVHRGRRLCAGDVATRRSSCASRARSSSAARRW